jgi:phospholipase C
VPGGDAVEHHWPVAGNGNWYDFSVLGQDFERRFAGRLENGRATVSDPAMGPGQSTGHGDSGDHGDHGGNPSRND